MWTGRTGLRRVVTDWTLAVCVAATTMVTALSADRSDASLNPFGWALLGVSGLALAGRRRAPLSLLAVTGLCALGSQSLGFDAPALAYLVAVYSAVRAGHRLFTVAISVAMLAALPLVILASSDESAGAAFAQARGALELAWLVAAGAAGEALRQAERRADEAERTREETARRRANEERLHIARELHDSLTHQISIIKVQSEVAVHLAAKRGEQASDALLAIRQAGREATRELRATLEALRDDDKAPPNGLDDVPALVERACASGLHATLTIEGQPHNVPAAVDRTAYRIVQESLTNIARHAAAATATVQIDYGPDTVAVRVDDDGTARLGTTPQPGVGLLGMRERVSALGGRLCAEPRDEGGFRVHAELPVGRP